MFARSAIRALQPSLARGARRFGAPAAPAEVAPVAEKDMWHKKSGAEFVMKEIGRADFMPFFVGLTLTFFMLGIGTLPNEEAKKSSAYYNQFVLGKVKEGGHH